MIFFFFLFYFFYILGPTTLIIKKKYRNLLVRPQNYKRKEKKFSLTNLARSTSAGHTVTRKATGQITQSGEREKEKKIDSLSHMNGQPGHRPQKKQRKRYSGLVGDHSMWRES